jgi:hypothetical protein
LKQDVDALQGRWIADGGIIREDTAPNFIKAIGQKETKIQIVGNELQVGDMKLKFDNTGFDAATMDRIAKGNGIGARPAKFVAADGKEYVVGYEIQKDSITFRYPVGCCSRSGTVIRLEKAK